MEYINFFDKDNKRLTSLREGIHFNEQTAHIVIDDYMRTNPEAVKYKESNEYDYYDLINGVIVFDGENFVEKQEEANDELELKIKKAKLAANYRSNLQAYKENLTTAMLANNENAIEDIKEEFKEFQDKYFEELRKLEEA